MCLPLMKMSGGRGATSYSSMVIGCVGELVRVNILTVSNLYSPARAVLGCADQAQTFLILWTC